MRKKQQAMQSLLQDIMQPATAVLLDTIDATMNSNTMLFKVRSDQLITASNVHDILNLFLHNPLFREMFFLLEKKGFLYVHITSPDERSV